MGTNYYWFKDVCAHCKRAEAKYHVGKSSIGWSFSFQALEAHESPTGRPIVSAADWREVFAAGQGILRDEYGEDHTPEKFWALVEAKYSGQKHASMYPSNNDYLDKDGHSFTLGYFS